VDHRSFDDLTRSLAGGRSRRGVLRAAGAFALAALGTRAAAGEVAADAYAPVPLKRPKTFKQLRRRAEGRTPCGGGYCTAEQTCNATQTGCVPEGGVECGPGYCVAGEQTCVDGGCLPRGSTACGDGRCGEDDYCVDGQAVCVDDCPAERACGGTCCAEGTACGAQTGVCAPDEPDPVCESGGTCGTYAFGCSGDDACACATIAGDATACVAIVRATPPSSARSSATRTAPTGPSAWSAAAAATRLHAHVRRGGRGVSHPGGQ
jgi:hypothetical protein